MRIIFEEEGHKYYREDNVPYQSVSGFIHQVEPYIDWAAKAVKSAKNMKKYKGIDITPKELLAKWENAKNRGAEAGTLLHKKKEQELLGDTTLTIRNSEWLGDRKYSMDISSLEDNTTYPELLMYDHDLRICGQSDQVDIYNSVIDIIDTKTDKKIEFKSYTSEWVRPSYLKPPVSHLEACNGNLYSLKMSLYMYMVWKANGGRYKPGKIKLVWCPIERDEDGIPILYDGQPKQVGEEIIEIPYRKKEVMDILRQYGTKDI